MVKISNDYVEKVYAGWLGKVIGVRHGANVENWTYERLERTFGEIRGYLHEFKNFAADDDTNGPIFFLRALEDYMATRDITQEQMGLTLLNYVPDGHGFFWWGGYGVSTEHTAYLNLKNGIHAPRSGSIEQNGVVIAEQIGGQIFSDPWGLIAPGDPLLAAEFADKMASVTHDGNGRFGAKFIAGCVAGAFTSESINEIIDAGLSTIPAQSEYAQMIGRIRDYYEQYPEHWRDCFRFVQENYGYDRYSGVCHIIPNAAVIVLSLLYGDGDFSQSINICNMCGWDTDCNVGNVGTILGVFNGLEGISASWRTPINDFLCCSSVIGTLNILDLPWCASYIARIGYLVAEQEIPAQWESILKHESPKFHFQYPGSTHAFRTDSDSTWQVTSKTENTTEIGEGRSLKVMFDKVRGGFGYRAYHQTYYRPHHFDDNRYSPSFSPLVYPGQTITAKVTVDPFIDGSVQARLYVKEGNSSHCYFGDKITLTAGEWSCLSYRIPPMSGACIEQIGIEWIPVEANNNSLIAYIDHMDVQGRADYKVDFSKERLEQWSDFQIEISQFTYLRGLWTLEDGKLSGSYYGEPAECYTGDIRWEDYEFEAHIIPVAGYNHHIQFRVQGGVRSYAIGLAPNHKLALYKNENGYRLLYETDFAWNMNQVYGIKVKAIDNSFACSIDGNLVFEYSDTVNPYKFGQIGFSNFNASHTLVEDFSVRGY